MKSKFSYHNNIHVAICLKSCGLYFLNVDCHLEVELRVNDLFLQEFLCPYALKGSSFLLGTI